MKLCTASETLRFLRELEEKAAAFYETLAARFPDHGNVFLAYAQENRKFNKQIQMAYQSVITDAIEGCYAFNLQAEKYTFDAELPEGAGLSEAAAKALAIEEKLLGCYAAGADQSGPLLADLPRNFRLVMKKRAVRRDALGSLV